MTQTTVPSAQQVLLALREARTKLEALEQQATEPIAIIGLGCRFPGAENPAAFWQLLQQGRDAITEIPAQRWDLAAQYSPDPDDATRMYTRHIGALAAVDQFDAHFFGISPREAKALDPQQRLLLEVCWEALEDAGVPPDKLRRTPTGVFIGLSTNDYSQVIDRETAAQRDHHHFLGNLNNMAAGRIAYHLGLQGPTLQLDTACSSSLVAVHLACQSLRSGEANLALAGGVNLILAPQNMIGLCQLHALAPDGRCKTFDAAADGYGRGEGCGVVVLKRLSAALADGDPILALIRGSAVNHDGPSSGLTTPNGPAQEQLLRQALHNARLSPQAVSYIEAHGTGTALGDPIEIGALTAVFQPRMTPLWIGSVKTNIGHLEAAAGIAGLIKLVLSLQHAVIPPHLHLQNPNPLIAWSASVRVPSTLTPWSLPDAGASRIGGVSAFGFSGTNAHVLVEQAPPVAAHPHRATTMQPWHLLTLSAKSAAARQALVQRYLTFLAEQPTLSLADLCYSANTARTHFAHRLAMTADSLPNLRAKLAAYLRGESDAGISQGEPPEHQLAPSIAFLFTGQGAQYVNMGRDLYTTQPLFRQTLDRCDAILRAQMGESILAVLFSETGDTRHETEANERDVQSAVSSLQSPVSSLLDSTTYTQPVLFAFEYALAQLWLSWGIQPDMVMGHSVGELVAACVAGVFSLEDGLNLVAARGRLMGALPQDGAMVALLADEATIQAALAPYQHEVAIAAVNGPESIVISGRREAVQVIVAELVAQGIKATPLTVSHAFHSPLMEPMLAPFRQIAQSIIYHQPALPLITNGTGQIAGQEVTTPDYWVRHVRNTVRFAAGVQTLQSQGVTIFLEIGPKPTLLGMAQAILEFDRGPQDGILDPQADDFVLSIKNQKSKIKNSLLPSLRPGRNDWQQMLESVGELYVNGAPVDWKAVAPDDGRRKVPLPTYPFQRQRYWVDTDPTSPVHQGAHSGNSLRPLIDRQIRLAQQQQTLYETHFSVTTLPFLADHLVYGAVVVPGACHLALALSGAELLLTGAPCTIQHLIFPQALILAEGAARMVQLLVEATPQSAKQAPAEFRIVSFVDDEAALDAPITHATGQLTPLAASPPVVDLAALQARCPTPGTPDAAYAAIAAVQVTLGPRFRWFHSLWFGAGEAIARLAPPAELPDRQGYRLFPSLLDACFQLVGVAGMREDGSGLPPEPLLPFAVEALHFYGPSSHDDLWCHVRQVEEKLWDLTLCTATGQVIAAINGFAVRAVPATALRAIPHPTAELYTVDWVKRPLPTPNPSVEKPAAWLLLGGHQGLGALVAERLATGGAPTIVATPGAGYRWPPAGANGVQVVMVDLTEPAQVKRLLRDLAGRFASLGIVYLSALEETPGQPEVAEWTLHLCGGLLHLVQALLDDGPTARLWVVTQGCQTVEDGALPVPDPVAMSANAAGGALWGFARTLMREQPHLPCFCIDLADSAPIVQAATLYEELLADLDADTPETQVVYQQQTRYAARLSRWQPPAHDPVRPALTAAGVYLITGGLGALGLAIAEQLVADGARLVVLSGRRQPSAPAQERIDRLTAQGATIQVVQADVSNPAAVSRLLAACQALAPVRGIVHAAGVLDDGVIAQQTLARWRNVLAPKVMGSWLLHTQTLGMALDFFVCCSSAAALLGAPGQSAYAAANAFMDRLMVQRRRQGLPGLSIQWGPWAGTAGMLGMAGALTEHFQTQGIHPLSSTQGRQWFSQLLTLAVAQMSVLAIDWAHFVQTLPPAAKPLLTQLVPSVAPTPKPVTTAQLHAQVMSAAPPERAALLITYLQTATAHILHTQTLPGLRQSFTDMGMDSLMGVELRNRLQTALALTLPATLLFKYTTIEELAHFLLTRIEQQAPTHGTQPPAAPAPHTASPAVVDPDDGALTESELAAALADKMRELALLLA